MHTSSASPIRQVAIVTGASRGIGAATAQLLARQQFAVCVNYRSNHEAAHNVVASIRQHGGQAISYQADVTDENQVAALFEETRNTFGEVTHLVNNAGVLQRQTRLENIDSDRFQNILLGNVHSSCPVHMFLSEFQMKSSWEWSETEEQLEKN